jgi:hypothetical protein
MVGRAAPRPDTTNASGVRTLVPAGAWRASSVRGGHTARASSRASLQTCIPTPRTERHTPVPRGDLHSISPSVPTFHGFRPPASKGASNGRRTGNPTWPSIGNGASDLRGESAEPGLQRGGTRAAMRVPVPRPGFGPSTPPCTGTSLRRARGERRTNHRR